MEYALRAIQILQTMLSFNVQDVIQKLRQIPNIAVSRDMYGIVQIAINVIQQEAEDNLYQTTFCS